MKELKEKHPEWRYSKRKKAEKTKKTPGAEEGSMEEMELNYHQQKEAEAFDAELEGEVISQERGGVEELNFLELEEEEQGEQQEQGEQEQEVQEQGEQEANEHGSERHQLLEIERIMDYINWDLFGSPGSS